MAPALDLEWDPARHSGNDRWSNLSSQEIVAKVEKWLELVEAAFGVEPIIYTNKSWWEGRIGSHGQKLSKYKFWIANYSHHGDTPPMMEGFDWVMWQFTGNGHINGIDTVVDISLMNPNGSMSGAGSTPSVTPTPTPEPPKPACIEPTVQVAQAVLTKAELTKVFDAIRDQFGELNADQVNFFNVLVNTASPRMLRSLIADSEKSLLNSVEEKDFFDVARSDVGGGSLTKGQVTLLNELVQTAESQAVRDCIIR